MAVTHGHGNPPWTRDEVILALDLYFDCAGMIPGKNDARVVALSNLLRHSPEHRLATKKQSFRNADSVVFKLQNIRQVASGRGLANVSTVDRAVWTELGDNVQRVRELSSLIRLAIGALNEANTKSIFVDEEFVEGRVITALHVQRERNKKVRAELLAERRTVGPLECDICGRTEQDFPESLADAVFEAHHIVPLAKGEARRTLLRDMAVVCANCHRMLHRAIVIAGRWLTIEECKSAIARPTGHKVLRDSDH